MTSSPQIADPHADLPALRVAIRTWLRDHEAELQPYRHEIVGDIPQMYTHVRPLQRMLCEAGWTRLGWPVEVGGLGGSAVMRAELMEEFAAAGYAFPDLLATIEIMGPMLVKYAPELAAQHLPAAIAGDEVWCQGFSEPEAGSDLGGLRCKAVPTDGPNGPGFVLSGQKMWSSYGSISKRCCVLARTNDNGHRGLSMLWVDLDSPGVTMVPTMCETHRDDVSELFFDDVFVPLDRLVGPEGAGWEVVMFLLQYERGAYAWKRQAEMHTHLQEVLHQADPVAAAAHTTAIGEAYLAIFALRSQAGPTLGLLDSGAALGPGISVDKLLLGVAEQTITDTARNVLWPALELDDTEAAERWRRRWSYTRITTIYGGAAEVQRDLVAERLLGLPRGK